tara:strand:- start:27 stop:350 length:324 start_codon:yes stop_codon:yes gene_type:complete
MKAYLIDPKKQEVTEVDYSGDYKDIYKLIDCSTFDVVGITPKGDGIYVDDEGLFAEERVYWQFDYSDGQPYIRLVNKGLVLGTTIEGDSIEPDISLEKVKEKVVWHW